tara:strand:- start:138 stop:1454 length:1317 start_codon:yes stop_codon:yes gene_type:complete
MADLASIDKILKEYYLGPVQEQLNNEVLLLSRLEARSEDLVGKAAFVPLHAGRSAGIGAVGESAQLPAAGSQTYARAEYDLKYLYGRVQVTGPSMAKSKSDAGSFLQILKGELDGVRNDLQKDLARQVYGTGDGVIGTGALSGTGTLVTLTDWEPLKKGQFYVGQTLTGAVASTGVQAAGSLLVTAVTIVGAATSTLTVTKTGTIADATYALSRSGSVTSAQALNRYNNTVRSNEIDGLQRVVNGFTPTSASAADGTFGTTAKSGSLGKIDSFTSTYWDNQRTFGGTPGTAEALTIMRVQQAINAGRQLGAMPSAIITSLGVQREFYRLLQANQQFVAPGATDYASGFSTLTYNGMPVIADIDAPFGKMFILDESTIKVFSDQNWHFLDADGQTLRQVANLDAYEAIMVRYMNVGATNRNKNVIINDISVNGVADVGV